jgi:hypothetical protein
MEDLKSKPESSDSAKIHPETRIVSSSIADRFSTKATAMVGEGLVRYCVLVDPKSLTKLPDFAGSCAGKFCSCFCTCVGGFENNRVSNRPSINCTLVSLSQPNLFLSYS